MVKKNTKVDSDLCLKPHMIQPDSINPDFPQSVRIGDSRDGIKFEKCGLYGRSNSHQVETVREEFKELYDQKSVYSYAKNWTIDDDQKNNLISEMVESYLEATSAEEIERQFMVYIFFTTMKTHGHTVPKGY